MTDDLDMGAIYNEYGLEETIRLAISAGNDLAMICHRIDAIGEARDALTKLPARQAGSRTRERRDVQGAHVAAARIFRGTHSARLDAEVWQLRVAVLGEERAAERSPEDGKRSPVETY